MRYLAVIQVKPDGAFEKVINSTDNGAIAIGQWRINANMDASTPALIQIHTIDNTVGFISSGTLSLGKNKIAGKDNASSKLVEMKHGKMYFKEVVDSMPPAMKKMMDKNNIK